MCSEFSYPAIKYKKGLCLGLKSDIDIAFPIHLRPGE